MIKKENSIMYVILVITLLFLFFLGIEILGQAGVISGLYNYRITIFAGWIVFLLIIVIIIAFTIWLTRRFLR